MEPEFVTLSSPEPELKYRSLDTLSQRDTYYCTSLFEAAESDHLLNSLIKLFAERFFNSIFCGFKAFKSARQRPSTARKLSEL